jgi:hypothetical protein
VKLKVDMLNTSMASCRVARGRKSLRSLLQKLFSRGLAFIVVLYLSNAIGSPACHHQAVVGFVGASFEGGRKSGGERGRLLNCGSALNEVRRGSNEEKEKPYGSD